MITDFFIQIGLWLLQTIIGFFPSSTGFPPEVMTAAITIGGYVTMISAIVPMATLATTVALAFSVEIAIFGFKTLRWLLGHIPVFGGNH